MSCAARTYGLNKTIGSGFICRSGAGVSKRILAKLAAKRLVFTDET
ncbi:hypothetical protein SOQ14_14055 [Erythrobacter sp. T5W1-R]|nr:hypothetical protein [Erythrobacter sp. T5W1-R]MEA1620041.1 hypothetical protein [Erythrobacter sp. T5W1-R]